MNDYELMTILHPRLNADETTAAIEAIQNRITEHGGTLLNTDVWGRRRLAYPIQHVLEGTYVLYTFEIEPTSTRHIESWLGINEAVIRHLLIRGIIPYDGPDSRGGDGRDRDRDRDRDEGRDGGAERAPAAEAAPAAPAAEASAAETAAPEAPVAEPAAAADAPADTASEASPAADASEAPAEND